MSAANGLMYTAKLQSIPITNVPQNLIEIIAGASTSLLIHSIRLEFAPFTTSGVAQDVRAQIAIQSITSTGTGGVSVTPAAEHPRNLVPAMTAINAAVTNPGTPGVVKSAFNSSVTVPFDRMLNADQRIPVAAGGRLAINLAAGLGIALPLSGEIYFEEF